LKAVWCDRALVETQYDFCLCVTEKQYHRELERFNVPKETWTPFTIGGTRAATLHPLDSKTGGRPAAIVCLALNPERTTMQTYAVLVHEAVHLWQLTKEYMGEDKPSPEFEAYAVQALSQRLFYAYDELTKPGKKK
jgi:hypothetical protein